MSDYIKREDAENIMLGSCDESALWKLRYLPSADVVEVVRCKDCKYAEIKDNGVLRATAYCHRLDVVIAGNGKGYCYLAERKDGDDDE